MLAIIRSPNNPRIHQIFLSMLLCGALITSSNHTGTLEHDKIWLVGSRQVSNQNFVYLLNEPSEERTSHKREDKLNEELEPTTASGIALSNETTEIRVKKFDDKVELKSENDQNIDASSFKPTHRVASQQVPATKAPEKSTSNREPHSPAKRRENAIVKTINENPRASIKSSRNMLKLFMMQPKISFTSLLPRKRPFETRPQVLHDPVFERGPLFGGDESGAPPFSARQLDTLIQGTLSPGVQPFIHYSPSAAQPIVLAHPHQARLAAISNFNAANPDIMINFDRIPRQSPFAGKLIETGGSRPPQRENFDQAAAQSTENYQRIKLANQANELPMFFATSNSDDSHFANQQQVPLTDPIFPQPTLNRTMIGSNSALGAGNADQQTHEIQTHLHTPSTTGEAAAAITQAVASLLAERARSLFGHLNGNTAPASSSPSLGLIGVHTDKEPMPMGDTRSKIHNPPQSNLGLASMIKSATEAWAGSSNSEQGNVGQGQEAIPTIVVENDGPTITSLNFGSNLVGQRPPPVVEENDPPEDEEVTAFYSEESDDSDSEGSHEAKRIAKLRQQHIHKHPFANQADPSTLDFYESPVTTDSLRNRLPFNQEIGPDSAHDYLRHQHAQSIVGRPSRYPDSINAIKDQSVPANLAQSAEDIAGNKNDTQDLATKMSDKLANSNNEQIDQLIKQLQELNKQKQASSKEAEKKRAKQVADEIDEDSFMKDEDEDDEQTKLLHKKLMARLRNKGRKREPSLDISKADSQGDAIKIPLHALLLAALDRRMSPSDQSTSSVMRDLISDDRNRDTIGLAQRDFHEGRNGLDSLIRSSPSYGSLITSPTLKFDNVLFGAGLNETDPLDADLINERPESEKSAGAESHRNDGNERSRRDYESDDDHRANQLSASTRAPVTSSRSAREKTQRGGQDSKKGRRDVSDEDDFDVTKQIERFSSERNEAPLEPSWVHDKRKETRKPILKKRKNKTNGPGVEFDDEYDTMSKATRKRILKRRRQPPQVNDSIYEDGENKFFEGVQRDTTAKVDIDRDIASLDEPDKSNSNKRQVRRPSLQNGLNEDNDDDDEESSDDSTNSDPNPDRDTSSGDDNSKMGSEPSASTDSSIKSWSPSMIDREVRKIENSARQRQQAKGISSASGNSVGDEPNDEGQEEALESQYHGSTERPEQSEATKATVGLFPVQDYNLL